VTQHHKGLYSCFSNAAVKLNYIGTSTLKVIGERLEYVTIELHIIVTVIHSPTEHRVRQ